MKRTILISLLLPLLTLTFVSQPPHDADSQPIRTPPIVRDSGTEPSPVTNSDRNAKLDTISMKAAILKEKTGEIRQGSIELEKATQKLLREVKKERDPATQIVVIEKQPDTVKDTTCVYLRDSVYSSLPWWKKYRILLKQCTIKRDVKNFFKRKKSKQT